MYYLIVLAFVLSLPLSQAQSSATDAPNLLLSTNEKGQWGAKNAEAEWMIEPTYDTLYALPRTHYDRSTRKVSYSGSGYWIGVRHGKQWVLNAMGAVLTKADVVLPRLMGSTILVKQGTHWGLKTLQGKVLLPTRCTEIAWHGDVLALLYKNQWHLLDAQQGYFYTKGAVDELRTTEVSPLHRLFFVKREGQWGVLNERLVELLPCEYDAIEVHPSKGPIEHLSQVQFIAENSEGKGILTITGDWQPLP